MNRLLGYAMALMTGSLVWSAAGDPPFPGGMLSPRTGDLEAVERNGQLRLHVALPVPLTPPPGVQQTGVWKSYDVVLSRTVYQMGRAENTAISYTCRIVRIRPDGENRHYVVETRVSPHIARGRYDVRFFGPGFSFQVADAVCVGDCAVEAGISVRGSGSSELTLQIHTSAGQEMDVVFDLALSAEVGGIRLSNGSNVLVPEDGTFGGDGPGSNSLRVLRYRLPRTEAVSMPLSVRMLAAAPKPVVIHSESKKKEPFGWNGFRVTSEVDPISVLWDFGHGEGAEGADVGYRRVSPETPGVRVFLLDSSGMVHSGEFSFAVQRQRTMGTGCSMCSSVAMTSGLAKLIFVLFGLHLWE